MRYLASVFVAFLTTTAVAKDSLNTILIMDRSGSIWRQMEGVAKIPITQCAEQLGLTEEDVNRTASMLDSDKDGFSNLEDVCPAVADPDQSDIDGDGVGDICDVCPNISAPGFMNGCLE